MFSELEKKALVDEIGAAATKKVEAVLADHNVKMLGIVEEAKKNNGVSQEDFETLKAAQEAATIKMEKIAKEQGKTLGDIKSAIGTAGAVKGDSIAALLKKEEKNLAKVFNSGSGTADYEIFMHKGDVYMRPYDRAKAAFTHATIDDVDDPSNASSIAQSLDATSILRLGADAEVINQYRNSPYIFDLCNTITASQADKLAIWINETDKQGGSTAVVEGASKPKSQYFYELKSSPYRKEATLLTFTEEFDMDFSRLQQNAVASARIDLVNRINTAILPRLLSAATTYSTGATFAAIAELSDPNDFDAIAAMAAEVDSATFGGAQVNAALMSTFKKYAMGLTKDLQQAYLNTPDVIKNVAFVGNPGMAADDVIVGDFKQYNIMLRGGMIMKVGYNGTDFAENKFSVVLEQYYFDYISTIRAKALVKGQTFATVKTAITVAP